jgi:hypothetical protein
MSSCGVSVPLRLYSLPESLALNILSPPCKITIDHTHHEATLFFPTTSNDNGLRTAILHIEDVLLDLALQYRHEWFRSTDGSTVSKDHVCDMRQSSVTDDDGSGCSTLTVRFPPMMTIFDATGSLVSIEDVSSPCTAYASMELCEIHIHDASWTAPWRLQNLRCIQTGKGSE